MIFISSKSKLKLVVHSDETETKFNNAGKPFHVVHEKVLYAQFLPDRHVPAAFRDHAVNYFNNPGFQSPWTPAGLEGVRPTSEGISGIGMTVDGFSDGEFYNADDPRFRLGILDTAEPSHVAPEHREEVEAFLLSSPLLGQWFINYATTLPLPWPAYSKLTVKPEDIKRLLQRIEDLTEDGQENAADYVIQFERENGNRGMFINAVLKTLGFETLEEYDAAKAADKAAEKASK